MNIFFYNNTRKNLSTFTRKYILNYFPFAKNDVINNFNDLTNVYHYEHDLYFRH